MAAVADLSRPTLEALQAPYHIGTVTLRVNDLAGLTAFYRDSIGLQVIAETAEATDLGVDGARHGGVAGPAHLSEDDGLGREVLDLEQSRRVAQALVRERREEAHLAQHLYDQAVAQPV